MEYFWLINLFAAMYATYVLGKFAGDIFYDGFTRFTGITSLALVAVIVFNVIAISWYI